MLSPLDNSEKEKKSSSAGRRCKVCKELIKGHKGKPGAGKCTNLIIKSGPIDENDKKKNIVELLANDTKLSSTIKRLEGELEHLTVDEGEKDYRESERDRPMFMDLGGRVVQDYISGEYIEGDLEGSNIEGKDSNVQNDEEGNVNVEESALVEDFGDSLPNAAYENSFELPSIEESMKKKHTVRINSSSDIQVDVRKLIDGRKYAICTCYMEDFEHICECSGEISFEESWSSGVSLKDFPLLGNPVTKQNLAVQLKVEKESWSEYEPNVLKLMPESEEAGLSLEGQVTVRASRKVHIIKGRKQLETTFMIVFSDISIALIGKCDRQVLEIEEMKADLFELEDEDSVHLTSNDKSRSMFKENLSETLGSPVSDDSSSIDYFSSGDYSSNDSLTFNN